MAKKLPSLARLPVYMRQNEQTEAWLHIHPILALLVLVLALPLSLSLSPSPALQFTLLPMAREQVKPTEHLLRGSLALPRGSLALPRGSLALPRGSLPRGSLALPDRRLHLTMR